MQEWNKSRRVRRLRKRWAARVLEQLREVAVELQMAPIRNAVHIRRTSIDDDGRNGRPRRSSSRPLKNAAKACSTSLQWWGNALKVARRRRDIILYKNNVHRMADKNKSLFTRRRRATFATRRRIFSPSNHVAFTDYNVASDLTKRQEMIQKSGQMGVPVIDVGGDSSSDSTRTVCANSSVLRLSAPARYRRPPGEVIQGVFGGTSTTIPKAPRSGSRL